MAATCAGLLTICRGTAIAPDDKAILDTDWMELVAAWTSTADRVLSPSLFIVRFEMTDWRFVCLSTGLKPWLNNVFEGLLCPGFCFCPVTFALWPPAEEVVCVCGDGDDLGIIGTLLERLINELAAAPCTCDAGIGDEIWDNIWGAWDSTTCWVPAPVTNNILFWFN